MTPRPDPSDTPAPAGAASWERAAAKVLRQAGQLTEDADAAQVWAALTTHTLDGVPVPPLGTPDRAIRVEVPAGRRGPWDIRSWVRVTDPAAAARDALADLANGAGSVWLDLTDGSGADLAAALDGVFLDMVPIVLTAGEAGPAEALLQVFRDSGAGPHQGSCLGLDPVGRAVRGQGRPDLGELVSPARQAAEMGIRAAVADGTAAHDAGAGDVGELGYVLATAVAYLRTLVDVGHTPAAAAGLIEFRLAVTDDQFPTMAKLRAARLLWARVLELCGVVDVAQFQHAVTSVPMMTRHDPWVNLLRTTVAGVAAGVGGADAITVLPFDLRLGTPDADGRRLATNLSALLLDEAHLAVVADPAAGSYALDTLTAATADAGWQEFRRLEAAGGVVAAWTDGTLAAGFDATAAVRSGRVATRRQPVTGVSTFPNLHEKLPSRPVDGPLPPSWAQAYEAFRDHPATRPVLVAVVGSRAAAAARVGFLVPALAAGGVDVVTVVVTDSDTAVQAWREAGSPPVVALAGNETAYAEDGLALAGAFRAAGVRRLVLAGRPRGPLAAAVDDALAEGDDLVAFLARTRQALEAEETR
ncbi:MAG: methylmalonyl-CoA mutase family protein [Nakamurella sp.]